jgi:hypothetical protein
MREVGVLGIFRSGTNFVRTILEWNYDCRVVNNVHGWKHGFFPVIVAESKLRYPEIDFIHVTKNPFSSIASLYRYYANREMNLGASREWTAFLRGRLIVFDSSQSHSPQYRFANPVDYWNAMNWNLASVELPAGRSVHVQYERLLKAPEFEASRIAGALKLTKRAATEFRVPLTRVRNMGDGPREKDEDYVTSNPFEPARYGPERAYLAQFNEDDLRFVLGSLDTELAGRLGYTDEIEFIRNRVPARSCGANRSSAASDSSG